MTMMIRIVTILLSMVPSVEKEATARRLEGRKLEGKRREVERRTRGKKKKKRRAHPKKKHCTFFSPCFSPLSQLFKSQSFLSGETTLCTLSDPMLPSSGTRTAARVTGKTASAAAASPSATQFSGGRRAPPRVLSSTAMASSLSSLLVSFFGKLAFFSAFPVALSAGCSQ